MAVLGVILSEYAAFNCEFIDVSGVGAFGLNSYEAQDEREDSFYPCVLYSKGDIEYIELGAAWQTGRSFATIAFSVGFILMIVALCVSCVAFKPIVLRCLACGFAFCFLMQSLVFVALSTDFCNWSSCDLAGAAYAAIVAVVVWFATAIAMAKMPHFVQEQDSVPGEMNIDQEMEVAPASTQRKPDQQALQQVSF